MTLFLTQIMMNKIDAAKNRFSDAYAWHNAVWECFPEKEGQKRKFLFRLDELTRDFKILLLSPDKPVQLKWGLWQIKPVAPTFLTHKTYRFQVKANPTMRRFSDRRRVGIYDQKKLHEWMKTKASQNGFSIADNSLKITGPMDDTFFRKGRFGKHTWADFSGILHVNEEKQFRHAFKNGIGSAKAFGYGMLMLQPMIH